MAGSLRSKETALRYEAYQKAGGLLGSCVLCAKEPRHEFTYWKIIENAFPYDAVASRHDMIIPKRHAIEVELTNEEKEEFERIKHESPIQDYQFIMEANHWAKSIPPHFHLHLVIIKDELEDEGPPASPPILPELGLA